jgi:hypothetical protein
VRFLPRPSALVSLAVALIFSAWWAWGPAPGRRPASVVAGNGLYNHYLQEHPEAYPSEPDYCLQLGDFPLGFEVIIFVASLWPLGLAIRYVSRARAVRAARRVGFCRGCGYDLRATPDRCPECGRAVELIFGVAR